MLLKEFNHTFNLVNEDLNLWGQFFIIRNNLHDFSQQVFVFWEIVRVLNNTIGSMLIEILEICKDDLDLGQQESGIDIDPSLDLDFQGVSKGADDDSEPTDVDALAHLLDFTALVLEFGDDFVKELKRWDSGFSAFEEG